ncbi:uncharacterized protein LOC123546965 [Mercenaria mercenaria]|uniref:uncharacterized protein LOC123546965 n=1 Tax=Mercenaria mercenaria TaxID=6596 RepID=UPI00234EBD76|nr:uncharacterized protein LOC123546965 [Mercenaria mercenaria]
MDSLKECSCAPFAGCSYEEVLEQAPCPPPFFYSRFAAYAIVQSLCSPQICKIAKRCMTTLPTNDSQQIIQSICFPTTPTFSTTPKTTIKTPLTATASITATTTTNIITTTTTAMMPTIPHTTPVPPPPCFSSGCLIALIVTLVLVFIITTCIVTLVVKYKRNGKFQIGKWKSFSLFRYRRNTDQKDLFVRTENKMKVCFDNPNYSMCFETIETHEFQERARISNKTSDVQGSIVESRISKTEVELHKKWKDEGCTLDTIITDQVRSVILVEKKPVEQHMQEELSGSRSSSILNDKETGLNENMLADISEIGSANTAVLHEEHEKTETINNETFNAQIKPLEEDKTKENVKDCDGDDGAETIQGNLETIDRETVGTATETFDEIRNSVANITTTKIFDEPRDSVTIGTAKEISDETGHSLSNGTANEISDETTDSVSNGTVKEVSDETRNSETSATATDISDKTDDTDTTCTDTEVFHDNVTKEDICDSTFNMHESIA